MHIGGRRMSCAKAWVTSARGCRPDSQEIPAALSVIPKGLCASGRLQIPVLLTVCVCPPLTREAFRNGSLLQNQPGGVVRVGVGSVNSRHMLGTSVQSGFASTAGDEALHCCHGGGAAGI